MPVPTQKELEKRHSIASDRLDRLRIAYDTFTQEWSDIEKEEFALLQSLHNDVNKYQLHSILKKIEDIKE